MFELALAAALAINLTLLALELLGLEDSDRFIAAPLLAALFAVLMAPFVISAP